MKTDDLIAMLARGVEPVVPAAGRDRCAVALGLGVAGSGVLMAIVLGVRPDLAAAARLPMFWVKLAFPAALAAAALAAAWRLARPGARLGSLPLAMAAPVAAMWLAAAVALIGAAPDARAALVLGESARSCPLNIALLSLPVFCGLLWAMAGLAPTRLAAAGAAAGLAAGAAGAVVYALHCTEMAAPFLAIWYLLGMFVPAAAGALLGPHLLRW